MSPADHATLRRRHLIGVGWLRPPRPPLPLWRVGCALVQGLHHQRLLRKVRGGRWRPVHVHDRRLRVHGACDCTALLSRACVGWARSTAKCLRWLHCAHARELQVWGWLCPDFSWPRIKAGWTWFHNWDITMEESIRRPSGAWLRAADGLCRVARCAARQPVEPRLVLPLSRPAGLVSLSPMQSRTRNIGMQGINFNVNDPNEISKWHSLYIPNKPIDYSGKTPIVVSTAARAVDVSAAARSLGMSGAEAAGVAPVVQR